MFRRNKSRPTVQKALLATSTVVCLACWATPAQAQTSAPASLNHEALVNDAAKIPIIRPPLVNADGKPLSPDQTKLAEKATEQLQSAIAAKNEGDFQKAAGLASDAATIREGIFGGRHFLTIEAGALHRQLIERSKQPANMQKQLHAADMQLRDARQLHEAGKYEDARKLAQEALSHYEKTLASDEVAIGEALLVIGTADIELRLFEDAELTLGRSLSISESVFGENHPALAPILDRLGWMSLNLAGAEGFRGKEARRSVEYLSRALRILQKTVGETAEFAETLDNRGTIQAQIGNDDEALKNKIRALVIRQAVLGPEAKDTGVSYSNLAWLYGQLGAPDLVIPLRRKALALFEKHLDPRHPYRFLEKANLARDLIRSGQKDEGVRLFEEMHAADVKDAAFDGGTVDRTAELGAIYLQFGRYDDALRLFDEAVAGTKKLREQGKKQEAINALQRILFAGNGRRMFDTPLPYYELIVEWDNQDRGRGDKPEYAARAAALGALYMQTGRLEEARRTLNIAVGRIQKLAGASSLELAPPMLNLARVHSLMGETAKAESLCEEVLRISEDHASRMADSTGQRSQSAAAAFAMIWLGRMQTLQKKYADAEFNLSEAQRLFDEFGRHDIPAGISIRKQRAFLLAETNRKAEAITVLREALELAREWGKKVDPVFAAATLSDVLNDLITYADANDSALRSDRDAWQSELKSHLLELEKARALSAEEKEWLAALRK